MTKPPKEKAALRQDKLLSHTSAAKANIEKARAHLLGVCLHDAKYAHCLPAIIHLSVYEALTLGMIKQRMGVEGMARHLKAAGLCNAKEMLSRTMTALPDSADYSLLFCDAIQVLIVDGATV